MYLNNKSEIAAAAQAAKDLGYPTSQRDMRENDRYVMNIVARLAGGDLGEQRELDEAIRDAVAQVRL